MEEEIKGDDDIQHMIDDIFKEMASEDKRSTIAVDMKSILQVAIKSGMKRRLVESLRELIGEMAND